MCSYKLFWTSSATFLGWDLKNLFKKEGRITERINLRTDVIHKSTQSVLPGSAGKNGSTANNGMESPCKHEQSVRILNSKHLP